MKFDWKKRVKEDSDDMVSHIKHMKEEILREKREDRRLRGLRQIKNVIEHIRFHGTKQEQIEMYERRIRWAKEVEHQGRKAFRKALSKAGDDYRNAMWKVERAYYDLGKARTNWEMLVRNRRNFKTGKEREAEGFIDGTGFITSAPYFYKGPYGKQELYW